MVEFPLRLLLVYRSVTHPLLTRFPAFIHSIPWWCFFSTSTKLWWWNSRGTPWVTGSSLPSCLRSFRGRCASCKRRPPGPSHHDGVLHHEPTRTEKLKINPSWHANKPQDLSNVDKCLKSTDNKKKGKVEEYSYRGSWKNTTKDYKSIHLKLRIKNQPANA